MYNKKWCVLLVFCALVVTSCENGPPQIIRDDEALKEIHGNGTQQAENDENVSGTNDTNPNPQTNEQVGPDNGQGDRVTIPVGSGGVGGDSEVSVAKEVAVIPELNLDVEARFIAGDKIKIELADEVDMTREFTISNSGIISYPYAKKVKVLGQTVSEIEETLINKLGKYFVDPVINISVLNWAERRVYLYGVNGQNSVLLTPTKGMTASQLLISAGVSPKEADLNRISLTRRENGVQKVLTVPLQELLESYDLKKDIVLQPNDLIIVKEAPKIHVQGNVKSPGSFPLQKGQKFTLWYALSLAEGPNDEADLENIKILREAEAGYEVIVVSASDIKQREMILLAPDDIIVVPSQNENVVTVYGQVKKPGTVQMGGRSVRLSTVIANAGGLTQYASRSIRVFRYFADGKTQKFSIDFDAITDGDSKQDIEMQTGDVVYCDYGLW